MKKTEPLDLPSSPYSPTSSVYSESTAFETIPKIDDHAKRIEKSLEQLKNAKKSLENSIQEIENFNSSVIPQPVIISSTANCGTVCGCSTGTFGYHPELTDFLRTQGFSFNQSMNLLRALATLVNDTIMDFFVDQRITKLPKMKAKYESLTKSQVLEIFIDEIYFLLQMQWSVFHLFAGQLTISNDFVFSVNF